MGRPRTATSVLDARGAFKKHSERRNERAKEPKVSSPFPKSAPRHLSKGQAACWREVVRIAPAGVLTGADTLVVEVIACLLSEFREMKGMVPASRITRLTSEMAKIGLSPSARASLSVDDSDDDDDF
ncbi:MAG: terminase [Sphingopyxis sp.]|nr:MAG: terminase [Sphingopyxis sp.]